MYQPTTAQSSQLVGSYFHLNSNMYDKQKVIKSVELFLEGIGHPADDPNTKGTPERVAAMWEILLGGYQIDPNDYIKTFPSKSTTSVYVVNTQFYSFCAHHLLQFEGKIHVGYKPNGKVIGISKLVRIPRLFAKRLNLQEDLTQNIADCLETVLDTSDVIVRIESSHSCMTIRGVRSPEAVTVTTVKKGRYNSDKDTLDEFNNAITVKVVRSY